MERSSFFHFKFHLERAHVVLRYLHPTIDQIADWRGAYADSMPFASWIAIVARYSSSPRAQTRVCLRNQTPLLQFVTQQQP